MAVPALALGVISPTMQAQGTARVTPIPRIAGPVDSGTYVTLKGNTHPLAQARFDRGALPDNAPTGHMLLVLKRSPEQEAALAKLIADQQDPSSPRYHQWLTPESFGKQFGAADADVQALGGYLSSQGFAVGRVFQNHMAIEFSGTAGQVRSAFGTEVHSYFANGQHFHANASDPRIPAALAPVVAGISSLNNYKPSMALRTQKALFNAATHKAQPLYTDTANDVELVTPGDLAKLYNIPSNYDGTGVNVGVIGDSNINLSFLANYRSTFGLPANGPSVIIDGQDPGVNGDAVIAYAQIELIAATAPNAQVKYYVSATTDLDTGVDFATLRALDDNAVQVISFAFDSCEQALGLGGNTLFGAAWEQAAAQGMTVLVGAGNEGSADCDVPVNGVSTPATHGLAVNGYASTPWNTAVGATDFYYGPAGTITGTFTQNPTILKYWANNGTTSYTSALGYIPEQPLNESNLANDQIASTPVGVATGGGFSTLGQVTNGTTQSPYPTPYWQVNATKSYGATARAIPDVSIFGGALLNGSSYALCVEPIDCTGGSPGNLTYTVGGGTVSATGAFSGIAALIVQAKGVQGNINPTLYSMASTTPGAFHDLTKGDNSIACGAGSPNCQNGFLVQGNGQPAYAALAGYDAASGLGSVNVANLITGWTRPNTAAPTVTLSITSPGTNKPVTRFTHGTPVQVNVNVTGGSGTATGDVAIVTNSPLPSGGGLERLTLANGSAVNNNFTFFPGGTYQVTAQYTGDATYAPGVSVPVTLSVFHTSSVLFVNSQSFASGATVPYGTRLSMTLLVGATNQSDLGIPSGSITVFDNTKRITVLPLNAEGGATFATSNLAPGSHSLTFLYNGDLSFSSSSTASAVPVTIAAVATTTTLTASVSSVPSSSTAFDLIANVAAGSANTGNPPTGTVKFYAGTTLLGSGAVTGGLSSTGNAVGVADIRILGSSIAAAGSSVTATYTPSGTNYAGSTSAPLNLVNGGAANLAKTTLTLSPAVANVTQIFDISALTFNVAVSGGTSAPTGTVSFFSNGASVGAGSLSNGTLSFSVPFNPNTGYLMLPLGANTITAQYGGDATHAPSDNVYRLTVLDDTTAPDFSLQVNPTYQVITPTSLTANYYLRLTSLNGFSLTGDAIALSYNAPAGVTCTGNPAAPNFFKGQYATVTVSCTAQAAAVGTSQQTAASGTHRWWIAGGGTAFACVFLLGIPARRRKWQSMLGAMLLVILSVGMTACGDANKIANQAGYKPTTGVVSGPNAGTVTVAKGTYTITVTATAQILSATYPNTTTTVIHNLPVQLVVQ